MSTPSTMETMETHLTSTIIDISMSSLGSTNIANLPLSDPWCNSVKCLAFKAAEDASQAEIQFASQFLYGHWIVYYYCVFILGFSLLYFYRRLGAAYVDYPESKTTTLQKITAFWRAFSYRKLKIGMSLGHTLLIGLGIVFMAILTFVQRPYFRPRISYGSPPLGVRTGMMALALTPIIVALTGKYNFVTLVTGISYERLNILHRYIGYICFVLGLIHSIAFIVAILRDSNYSPLFEKIDATEYTGVLILLLLLFLCILSNPWIRKRFYETFAFSHFGAYILYLGFMFWHSDNRIDSWAYLYATLAIHFLSYLCRLFFKLNTSKWRGATASLQDLDGEMLKIIIPAVDGMTWTPGQHIFLRFPSISSLQNHPFTIASLCEETYVTNKIGTTTRTPLLVLVKSREGITKKLMHVAQRQDTVRVFVEGPYGGHHLNLEGAYEQFILVAGGSGISAMLPLLSMFCKKVGREGSMLRSAKLIWVVKSSHAQSWVHEEIKATLATASPGIVKIHLYITGEVSREKQLAWSFELDDVEMDVGLKAGRRDAEEERLLPNAVGISRETGEDIDGGISSDEFDDAEQKLGMRGDSQRLREYVNEGEKLLPMDRRKIQHQNHYHHPDKDYRIEADIIYGRPDFGDVIPRMLVEGGRVCIFGCGPQEMDVDLSNAVAACQTKVLKGYVSEIKLWTETFGW